jgi:hypothetical protein
LFCDEKYGGYPSADRKIMEILIMEMTNEKNPTLHGVTEYSKEAETDYPDRV